MFSQLLAGPVTRFFAWFIDQLCISAAMSILGTALNFLELINWNFAIALYVISYFVISIGYGIFLEWTWRGQTVGKRLLRLRVVDVEGMRLQFNQIVVRNLLRFVDALPAFYFVGGVACWLNPRCQRLGDIAANTVVIRNPRVAEPDLDQLLAGKYNSLRQYPHLAARLRQRISPAEANVALQALLRREEFDPGRPGGIVRRTGPPFPGAGRIPRRGHRRRRRRAISSQRGGRALPDARGCAGGKNRRCVKRHSLQKDFYRTSFRI